MWTIVKKIISTILSEDHYIQLRNWFRKQYARYEARRYLPVLWIYLKRFYMGNAYYCPICDSKLRKFLLFYEKPKRCPVCGSLDRHRLIWLFFNQKTNLFLPPNKRILHVAPEPFLRRHFQESDFIDYVSMDFAPIAMTQASLTELCFPDHTFDIVYASHVLEHISEDSLAMRELYRVLKIGGWGILQVPLKSGLTYEDSSIVDPDEREKAFGQFDHVRVYGEDYVDSLSEAGFIVNQDNFADQLDLVTVQKMGINPTEVIHYCVREQ